MGTDFKYLRSMPANEPWPYHFGVCPASKHAAALHLVLANVAAEQKASMVAQILADAKAGRRSLDGLLVATIADELAASIWVEVQPGHTAGVWPPQVLAGRPDALADELLRRANEVMLLADVHMAQVLLATDASPEADRFRSAGYEHLTDLLYLVSTSGRFPQTPIASALQFIEVSGESSQSLAEVITATYEGSSDCPSLNGKRHVADVLAGYRATAHDDLRHWFLIRHAENDVGCLLLARHADIETWELIYMGLVPAARGHGWGTDIVRHAQWHVAQQHGDRLMLAVDAANEPALRHYAAAGFWACDRRSVFVKFLAR